MGWTIWIAIGAISGALGVGFGAFGAHALNDKLSPEALSIFETAVKYQMYHTFALIAVGLIAVKIDGPAMRTAGSAFGIGILLFSGSLYALALSGQRWFGMVTPVGGLAFLVGWIALAFAALSP